MGDSAAINASGALLAGRYEVKEQIGRGATALIYRSHDTILGRDVALKVFHPHATDAEEIRRRDGEVSLLAAFSHPGLVTLFDAGTDTHGAGEPRAFLVMELVKGTDLRHRLELGTLPAQAVAAMGVELAEALHYIHGHGILHRDVKPGNILLPAETDNPLRPKLTDFGIARIMDAARTTANDSIPGTAAYLSPEQANSDSLTPASDIYSLALVLLECLTGNVEYPGGAVASAVARLTRDPVIPSHLDPQWVQVLTAMTAREPAARPSGREVARALEQIAGSGRRWSGDGLSSQPAPLRESVLEESHPTALTSIRLNDTASLSAERLGAERKVIHGKKWIRTFWIVGVLLLLSVAALLILGPLFPASVPDSDPVPYPSVPGQLGDRLQELQERVEP